MRYPKPFVPDWMDETDRDVEAIYKGRRTVFYDHDYQVELGSITDGEWKEACSYGGQGELLEKVCREPTSLEILYYAQMKGTA